MMGPLPTFPAHRLEKQQLAGEQILHLPQAKYPKFATRSQAACAALCHSIQDIP